MSWRGTFGLGCASLILAGVAVWPLASGFADSRVAANPQTRLSAADQAIRDSALDQIEQGRRIFRYETFGDEAFWGDTLALHDAIQGEAFGGVGPGVSPALALAVGLKVDADALPARLPRQIRRGEVDLENPATTLTLLRANADQYTAPVVQVRDSETSSSSSIVDLAEQSALKIKRPVAELPTGLPETANATPEAEFWE